jgi:hypothetical protein
VVTVVLLVRVGLLHATLTLEITTMTDDKIALRELLEKGSDTTLLREMIGFAAQRLMDLETDTLCGAGHGERSESRTATGRPGPELSNAASRSCAAAATSPASWNHDEWPRRR